jgi:cell division protein FtsI (penicillin-binding protein 3)
MEPSSGEILALAQYPFFFPDEYQNYFNNKDIIENSKVKAVSDANEPGSIMKPITLAIALMANQIMELQGKKPLFTKDEKIDTSVGRFPGRTKPLTDTHFHHYLNMNMGLQKSSNIYAATLVRRIVQTLGDDWYRSMLQDRFGFGVKTNIELPSESTGVLPRPGKKHPNGKLEWSVPTPYSIAMGHNIQATSIQMARAYCIFANGGYAVQPTLIRKIVKGDTVLVDNTKKEKNFVRLIPEPIVKEVMDAMKFLTKKGGTSPTANIWGYTECGKSGTSMKAVNGGYTNKKHITTFIGITPASKPAFVLLVSVDEPEVGFIPGKGVAHHGGTCCAPIFREIARRSLEYLGIPPDDPHGYPKGDPRYDPLKADWIPQVEQLNALYEQWNGKHK